MQRSLRRAFKRDEKVDVSDIFDTGQVVVQSHMEELGSRLIQTRLVMPDSAENNQTSLSSPKDPLLLQKSDQGSSKGESASNVDVDMTLSKSR